jgi:hypothetical protein
MSAAAAPGVLGVDDDGRPVYDDPDDHDHAGQIERFRTCHTCDRGLARAILADATRGRGPVEGPGSGGAPAPTVVQPSLDFGEVTGQNKLVLDLMADGAWRTITRIATELDIPETSASARLRDLRKPEFGGHDVVRRRTGTDADQGAYEYHVGP